MAFVFHVNITYKESPKSDEILEIARANYETLLLIKQNQETIMASQQQFQAALVRVEEATTKGATAATAIAARITALEEIIKGLGLSAEVEAQLLAQTEGLATGAEGLATSLEAMGKTPETPVPVPVPEPVPAPPAEG